MPVSTLPTSASDWAGGDTVGVKSPLTISARAATPSQLAARARGSSALARLAAAASARPLVATLAAVLAAAALVGGIVGGVAAARAAASGGAPAAGAPPQQIMLSAMAPGVLAVTWVIPYGASYAVVTPPSKSRFPDWVPATAIAGGLPAVLPRVEWALAAAAGGGGGALASSSPANTTQYNYTLGIDWRLTVSNATSPTIFSALISPLPPGAAFVYRVGDDANGFSPRTLAAAPRAAGIAGASLAVIGDLGTTTNSSWTRDHVLAAHAAAPFDAVLHLGDLSYSDGELPVWDIFGALVQPLASVLPFNSVVGNHEWGANPGTPANSAVDTPAFSFLSYVSRFRTPAGGNASRLYYSLNYGMMHVVFLAGYCPEMRDWAAPSPCLAPGSPQMVWLAADLAAVDRAATPWVVVLLHQPYYNSNWAHRRESEGAPTQVAVEDAVQGADLVLHGHVHSYERAARTYANACNGSAPVYITVGDGGNREGLAANWTNPQPAWSILRQASFGHGQLTAANATHLLWRWVQTPLLTPAVGDELWIVKGDPGACGPGETRLPQLAANGRRA